MQINVKYKINLVTDPPDRWLSNAFMTSAPRHMFWKKVICRGLMRNYKNQSVIHATGPCMLSDIYYKYFVDDIDEKASLPYKLFYPINYRDYTKETVEALSDDVVTIHHFANSWNTTKHNT